VDESRDLQGLNEFLKITLLDKEEKLFYGGSHSSEKLRLTAMPFTTFLISHKGKGFYSFPPGGRLGRG
jgi:hypothetical protein